MGTNRNDWEDRKTTDGDEWERSTTDGDDWDEPNAGRSRAEASRGADDWNAPTNSRPYPGDARAKEPIGVIDHYKIIKELGTGGFGSVYLARDTVERALVAVKGLPPKVRDNEEEMERIRTSFTLAARVRHPNVAAVRGLHPARSVSYVSEEAARKLNVRAGDVLLVMDYAPGATLSRWARQFPGGRVPLAEAVEVTRQVAAALDHAHGMRVIHRDVKPANVMVETRPDGRFTARVLDFGLAAEVRSSVNQSNRGLRSGTWQYMAPEQWKGEAQDAAVDQYALAAMFYELVTGDVPFAPVFECGDRMAMLAAVTSREPDIPKGLPRAVRKALARALSKDPGARFASCGDFAAALKWNRWGWGWMIAILAAVAAVGISGFLWNPVSTSSFDGRLDSSPVPVVDSDSSPVQPSAPTVEPVPSAPVRDVEPISVIDSGLRLQEAKELYEKAVAYRDGKGVEKDLVLAAQCMRDAADLGCVPAQCDLGVMYEKGLGVGEDDEKAVGWYQKAAEQGHTMAQSYLGFMYAEGLGVRKDEGKAAWWYQKAVEQCQKSAERGDEDAQDNLGWMYANGRGVRKDDEEAFRWYRKAAERGHVSAQNSLGCMYDNGLGVDEDDAKAFQWYQKAAEQGNASAQYNLGALYENGEGVDADVEKAVAWYQKAARQGNENAQGKLRIMGKDW